jgi:hypothetical protein
MRRFAQQSAWQLARRAGALTPVCAVARKPDAAAQTAPGWNGINLDLAERLYAGWSEWGLGTRPSSLAWVLLTGGTASFNKVVGLVTADDQEAPPRVAVKLARSPTSETGLLREARALSTLSLERPILRGIPRLLFCQPHTAGLALGETVVLGRPFAECVSRQNLRELALAATDWFIDLAGAAEPRPRAEWWPRLVECTLDAFDGLPGPVIVPELVARTRRLYAPLQDLPLTISHGDAGPSNVLLDAERRISVIDWEDCEPVGLPVGDLVALLTYLVFHLENPWRTGKFREVYRATLDRSTHYGELRAECLARYAHRAGLHPSALGPLALVPWMQRSVREHQGMLDASLGSEGREAFRRGLYVSLWEEELRAAEQS